MPVTEWFSMSSSCKQFADRLKLFEALQKLNTNAILCIQYKAAPVLKTLVKQYQLPAEAYDDLMSRATLTFLKKIEEGEYQF